MEQILIVDDDTELTELVTEYLEPEGFRVQAVHDGAAGLETAKQGKHDLLVLDVMLPQMGGLEVLRRLRASESDGASRLPVLMLTARGDDVDRIVGLELGADDYLPKPFNPRELTARIRAILRRSHAPVATTRAEDDLLAVGDLEVDKRARRVRRGGETVELTGVEFDLLTQLLLSPGESHSRGDLTQTVLGRRALPYDRSVDTHISNLRRKLGAHADGSERIKSIRGVGYVYVRSE